MDEWRSHSHPLPSPCLNLKTRVGYFGSSLGGILDHFLLEKKEEYVENFLLYVEVVSAQLLQHPPPSLLVRPLLRPPSPGHVLHFPPDIPKQSLRACGVAPYLHTEW